MSTFCLCYCNLSISKKVKEISFILRDRIHCDVNFSFIINDIGNIFHCSEKVKKNIMHICAQIYIYVAYICSTRQSTWGCQYQQNSPHSSITRCQQTLRVRQHSFENKQMNIQTNRDKNKQANRHSNKYIHKSHSYDKLPTNIKSAPTQKKQTNKTSKNHSLISGHQQTLIVANRALNLEHKQTQ